MKTRCKFKCTQVVPGKDDQAIMMEAVTGGSPDNESFFKYTPAGLLALSVVNKDLKFEVGKEYYLDITPA